MGVVAATAAQSIVDQRRGILLMLLTTFLFVSLDALAKHLVQTYSIVQVVWARYAFHAMLVVLVLRHRVPMHFRTQRLSLQLIRSLLLLATTAAFFAAVRHMQLVDATAISLAGPLLVTALSVPFLGEHVGVRRWIAVAIGFVGALVIVRPGTTMMNPAAIYPVMSMVAYAFYQISTRALSRFDPAMTTLLYTALAGGIVTTAAVPFFWIPPDLFDWGLMILLGLLGGAGHLALIKALTYASAVTVAPFSYSSLVWTTGLGFVVFAELPDLWTLAGAAIIIGSGLYVLHRERGEAIRSV
ncbi:MAG: DMT family transporter [Gammaproteobacteria bacterium]|nr:DMT family transporter [Gammaproteobacteria bacterium]